MVFPELKLAWAGKKSEVKEKVIAQFSKPITKNRQLTAYQSNISQAGYDSNYTANIQNSEGTFVFEADTFDTSASVNSDGEVEPIVTVNAAKSNGFLCNQSGRTIPKKLELPIAAPLRILANKQFRIVDDDGKFMGAATFNVSMAIANYARCDSLIPVDVPKKGSITKRI